MIEVKSKVNTDHKRSHLYSGQYLLFWKQFLVVQFKMIFVLLQNFVLKKLPITFRICTQSILFLSLWNGIHAHHLAKRSPFGIFLTPGLPVLFLHFVEISQLSLFSSFSSPSSSLTYSKAVRSTTWKKGTNWQRINQMSIILISEVGGRLSILLMKMVVITSMVVRFTLNAASKKNGLKKVVA